MSRTDKIAASKWNARHAWSKAHSVSESRILRLAHRYVPSEGVALDLACGRGGNTLSLASAGLQVQAWDISHEAISCVQKAALQCQLTQQIKTQVRDVVSSPPGKEQFDVVVVSRFLERSLCDAIAASLKPGGVLFYQTFTQGLSNSNYLLKRYELLSLFSSLDAYWYFDPSVNDTGRAESMLVAGKPDQTS